MTLGRAASGSKHLYLLLNLLILNWRVHQATLQHAAFHQATVDYRRYLSELPACCTRDDHLVRGSSHCSVLRSIFPDQFASSVGLGIHGVFCTLSSYSDPDEICRSPTVC